MNNYFKEGNRLFDVFEVILEVLANDHGVLIFEKDDIGQNPMSIFSTSSSVRMRNE